MLQRNPALVQGNALKLAMFGPNCVSGRTYAALPDRWDASWEHNVELAQLAESIGIEALIPIARWKGYGGISNPNGSTFESMVWAGGLLAVTRRINVFCTIHVPLHHPVVAAKQMATADHMGQGRFGVNLVCGSNQDEFRMFGVALVEHDGRYEQGAEWWSIVKRIWSGDTPFDFDGAYFQLGGVQGLPAPFGEQDPLMMNAGSSAAGRGFAIRYSDLHFDGVRTPAASIERIAETKRLAREQGRRLQVWTPTGIICRPTKREAADFLQYVVDHADWGALGYLAGRQEIAAQARPDEELGLHYHGTDPLERRVLARGAYCVVGDPDHVAGELARLHQVGFDGLGVNFVDYLKELPYFAQEVLSRLERLGLRTSVATSAAV
jgi:alkanesulfonate monooxygenase SsuD/methylene tetrahydromethanopterin reductase-like flavin-dependent oxidoreductase (luciferase family)